MDKEKKPIRDTKKIEAGVSGAIIGGAFLPTDFLDPITSKIANSNSPISGIYKNLDVIDKTVLNATASSVGAMAALGLLRSMKKASNERHARKLELAQARNNHIIKVNNS